MTAADAPRSQFEHRMRLRRASTCVSAARIALEAGRLGEAEERLEEACRLDPGNREATVLLEQVRSVEPHAVLLPPLLPEEPGATGFRRWSHWVAVLIAVVALATLAWWRAPGPDESRITPARQPEPQGHPRLDAPALVDRAPAGSPAFTEAAPPEGWTSTPEQRPERGTAGQLPPSPRSPRAREASASSALGASPVTPAPLSQPAAVSTPNEALSAPPEPAAAVPELPVEAPSREPSTPALAASDASSGSVAAPPSADAAPASMRDAVAEDEAAIGQVLERYADAYNRLDARAASRVWPTVDERALARAFAGLESQGISFDGCELTVQGADATAACRGRARYVPKVGDRDPISQSRRWTFRLHRAAAGWQIVHAEAR